MSDIMIIGLIGCALLVFSLYVFERAYKFMTLLKEVLIMAIEIVSKQKEFQTAFLEAHEEEIATLFEENPEPIKLHVSFEMQVTRDSRDD